LILFDKDGDLIVDPNIPTKISSMGIVLAKPNSKELRILTLECGGEWVFPKGHVIPGENFIETACREVKEESAVEIKTEECIGLVYEFSFYFDGEKANKLIKVHAFLVSETQPIIYNEVEDFTNGKWMTIEEALNILTHEDAKNALKKALAVLNKNVIKGRI